MSTTTSPCPEGRQDLVFHPSNGPLTKPRRAMALSTALGRVLVIFCWGAPQLV